MRKPKKLQYCPISFADWDRLTADLTDREACVLWRLVAFYCAEGGLPIDDASMAQIARVDLKTWRGKLRSRMAGRFPVEGWRWPEIDTQIERRQKTLLKRSAAGTAGAAKRWGALPGKKHDPVVPLKRR